MGKIKVSVKDIPVFYDGERYESGQEFEIDEKYFNEDIMEKGEVVEEEDYFSFSKEELSKVTKDDLKAFLDKEEIQYDSKANKDELINLIAGE